MPDIEFFDLRHRCDGRDCVEGEPVAHMHLKSHLCTCRCGLLQPLKLQASSGPIPIKTGVAIRPGMELNHRGSQAHSCFELFLICFYEEGHARRGGRQLRDHRRQSVVLADDIEPAFRCALFPVFRHQTDCVRPVPESNFHHFVRGSHFQIERKRQLIHQAIDVLIGNVTAVFAKMRGDTISTSGGRNISCP